MVIVEPYLVLESKRSDQPQYCDLCLFIPEWVLFKQTEYTEPTRTGYYACSGHVRDLLFQLSGSTFSRNTGDTGTQMFL